MQERPVCPRGLYHGFVSWPHQHWRSIFRPQWSDTHHLIVAHDVINQGHDRAQLAAMSKKAKGVLGTDKLEVLADAGYFSGEEILECDKADITTTLPKPLTSGIRPIRRLLLLGVDLERAIGDPLGFASETRLKQHRRRHAVQRGRLGFELERQTKLTQDVKRALSIPRRHLRVHQAEVHLGAALCGVELDLLAGFRRSRGLGAERRTPQQRGENRGAGNEG